MLQGPRHLASWQLQRQPPGLSGACRLVVSHAAQISPIPDSLASPHPFLDALADVSTFVSSSLHGTNGGASTILEGLVFVVAMLMTED